MIKTVTSLGPSGDPDDRREPRRHPEAEHPPAPAASPAAAAQPDIRLLIEQDEARGVIVYKLIDRATGQMVSKVSREDLIRMGADPAYSAGKVINTQA